MISARAVETWIKRASRSGILDGLAAGKLAGDTYLEYGALSKPGERAYGEELFWPRSVHRHHGKILLLVKVLDFDLLLILYRGKGGGVFQGVHKELRDLTLSFCPLSHQNAVSLRMLVGHAKPSVHRNSRASFGTGDRLGNASSGHIRAVRGYEVFPVLAQQSARELELCERSFNEVIDSVTWAVFREGFRKPWGADGDHLKTEQWVKNARSAGCTMITADVSDFLHEEYLSAPLGALRAAFDGMPGELRKRLDSIFLEMKKSTKGNRAIELSEEGFLRTALVYCDAIRHADLLYRAALEEGEDLNFELSIDETSHPTSPLAHLFISLELRNREISLYSIAPRFTGSFQKAVDYVGNIDEFEDTLKTHVQIARQFGHRLSVHSGSDKFRIYRCTGEITGGTFHLKTSGTSWLAALWVIAEIDPDLFAVIYREARRNAQAAMKMYQIMIRLDEMPDSLQDAAISEAFLDPQIRQLLHISYGAILRDPSLRERIFSTLRRNIETYWSRLDEHISAHLKALGIPSKTGG